MTCDMSKEDIQLSGGFFLSKQIRGRLPINKTNINSINLELRGGVLGLKKITWNEPEEN